MRSIVLVYTFCFYFGFIELAPNTKLKGLRIIGGEDDHENKYPYVVRLQYENRSTSKEGKAQKVKYRHVCTGASLTPTVTLTAGHCHVIAEERGMKISVVAYGPWDNITLSKVTQVILHPVYQNGIALTSQKHDIALIRNEPTILKQYARVSALDFLTLIGEEVIMTGYGKTNSSYKKRPIADDATTLQKPLQVLDGLIVKCDSGDPNYDGIICVARRCGKPSSLCPGDSGGPLLHSSGVVGVNSFITMQAKPFCDLKFRSNTVRSAGFIIPTSPYMDWLSDTIRREVPVSVDDVDTQIVDRQ